MWVTCKKIQTVCVRNRRFQRDKMECYAFRSGALPPTEYFSQTSCHEPSEAQLSVGSPSNILIGYVRRTDPTQTQSIWVQSWRCPVGAARWLNHPLLYNVSPRCEGKASHWIEDEILNSQCYFFLITFRSVVSFKYCSPFSVSNRSQRKTPLPL